MKKVSYVIMIALAVYALQGCNNNTKATNKNAAGAPAQTDTSGGVKAPANPNGPANPAGAANTHRAVEQEPMKINNADAKIANAMAEENMSAITMSVIAGQITRNPQIKAIADTIAAGYHQINNNLIIIAKTKNLLVPTSVSPATEKQIEKLEKKSGKDFDKEYLSTIAESNKKAMSLYSGAGGGFTDVDLRTLAAKAKPVVQKQMNAITAAQGRI